MKKRLSGHFIAWGIVELLFTVCFLCASFVSFQVILGYKLLEEGNLWLPLEIRTFLAVWMLSFGLFCGINFVLSLIRGETEVLKNRFLESRRRRKPGRSS